MARYLTASKVGLLGLVHLYTEATIPTSATIPILSFIIKHTLKKRSSLDEQHNWDASPLVSIEELQAATKSFASAIPGRSLWDLLLRELWNIDSFDGLHVFFESLEALFVSIGEDPGSPENVNLQQNTNRFKLSKTSPLGIFVRKSILEFTRLPLHDGISLWKAFVAYREPTLSIWKRRNPSVGRPSLESSFDLKGNKRMSNILYGDASITQGAYQMASAEDGEKILEFQIDQMQKVGQRVSMDIRDKIESMINAGSTVSSLSYYIKFLDAWKGGDYTSALDNLHRYFDYTMHIQGRTFYQYALVNMAIMQADFGCFSEAITAMHESIAMARENKDMGCLNFCLSWLYHFSTLHPSDIEGATYTGVLGADREALSFIKSKAKESGMWSLLSTSLLGEAGLALANGESISLAFENITRSAFLNNAKHVTIAHGNEIMVESSLYSRMGLSYMQWSRGDIFFENYAQQALAEDVMKFTCVRALMLTRRGRYDQALTTIEKVDLGTLRVLRFQQVWTTYAGLLKLQHSLHRGDLTAAHQYLSQLQTSAPKDRAIGHAISLLHVDLLIRRRQLCEATQIIDRLMMGTSPTQIDVHTKIKLMTLKARIYDESGVPQKGFSIAMRAASLAYKSRILDVLWHAVNVLCRILCSLSEFDGAAQLMKSVLPQVLEVEDHELIAACYSCLADAHMGLAGKVGKAGIKRKEQITKALEYLERAFEAFSKLGDVDHQCEMMAKRAATMHIIGDPVLANDYAAKYLAIRKAAKEEYQ